MGEFLEQLKADLKTGTTTVALAIREGVVLAADMRASMGHLAYDEESQKLYKITDNIALTNAGSVGDSLVLIRFLRTHAALYEIERETRITSRALSSFMSNILNGNRYYPYEVQFLIAGVNDGPEIFEVTPFGAVLERKKYAVSGSGTEFALTTLDQNFRQGMTEEEGIALAAKAIRAGTKRDIFSGGKSITAMVVDKKGVRQIEEKDIKKYLERIDAE